MDYRLVVSAVLGPVQMALSFTRNMAALTPIMMVGLIFEFYTIAVSAYFILNQIVSNGSTSFVGGHMTGTLAEFPLCFSTREYPTTQSY